MRGFFMLSEHACSFSFVYQIENIPIAGQHYFLQHFHASLARGNCTDTGSNLSIKEMELNNATQQASSVKPLILIDTANGNDVITGTSGDDVIVDFWGSNTISGGDGNDKIVSAGTMAGGRGDDTLIASNAHSNDVYLFNRGDGKDTIVENALDGSLSNRDELRLGAGISRAQITFRRVKSDLVIDLASGDQVTVSGWFQGSDKQIETIRLADGSTISSSTINKMNLVAQGGAGGKLVSGSEHADRLLGTSGNDSLYGRDGNDALYGRDGDDLIEGNGGDDVIYGGTGNDVINGGWGGSSEIYGQDGDDVIVAETGSNVIDGGEGNDLINAGQDSHGRNTVDGGAGDDVIVTNWGDDLIEGGAGNDTIKAGGGKDFIHDVQGKNLIQGGDGDDKIIGTGTMDGGTGNDRITGAGIMAGGKGDDRLMSYSRDSGDTYLFNKGDGRDVIADTGSQSTTDTLSFGAGIDVASLRIRRSDDDLIFEFVGNHDSITVENWYGAAARGMNNKLERIMFADGFVVTQLMIDAALAQGAGTLSIKRGDDGDNQFDAAGGSALLFGLGGNDTLRGSGGSDYIDGGQGDDVIEGGGGRDRLIGGNGDDIINGSGYFEGGEGDDVLAATDGSSDDLYLFRAGDGVDVIRERASNSTSSKNDILRFQDLDKESLWLAKEGADLMILRLGSSDKVVIKGWFQDSSKRIERIEAAGGAVLTDNKVDQLVEAMSGFTPPPPGLGSLPEAAQQAIQAALAASWQ